MVSDDDQCFLHAARSFWHPIARTVDVLAGQVVPVTLLGEDLVLWRAPEGTLSLLDDLCAHRGVRLSLGAVTETGCVRCPYHSWEYDDRRSLHTNPATRRRAGPGPRCRGHPPRRGAFRVDLGLPGPGR